MVDVFWCYHLWTSSINVKVKVLLYTSSYYSDFSALVFVKMCNGCAVHATWSKQPSKIITTIAQHNVIWLWQAFGIHIRALRIRCTNCCFSLPVLRTRSTVWNDIFRIQLQLILQQYILLSSDVCVWVCIW